MKKIFSMETNTIRKVFPAITLLTVFVGISLQYINAPPKEMRSEYNSTELKQVVTKKKNITRTDYYDRDMNLQIAANLGYATKLIAHQNNSEIEIYFDDQGERISSLYTGCYGILREYDEKGNNIRITYLDENSNPIVISLRYAVEEREFNESGQAVSCRYLDSEGNPVLSYYNGFGARYEYDEKGNRVRITYLDETGSPMILSSGYSILVREYYDAEGPQNGKVRKEFYLLPDGKPASLSLGHYGIYQEYDESGRTSLVKYLKADGSPIVTNKGYTSIAYTYYADNSVQSTLYYDINGNPFRMSEGQYGTKFKNGQTVYLNADGTEQFSIKYFLYDDSRLVIVIAITLVVISVFLRSRLNWLMLIIYIGVIVYFTLMHRETSRSAISVLRSYNRFFTSAELRASIIKNIWLFVPLGAILFRICPQKGILIIPFFLSLMIETTQYFEGTGLCEVDDIVSNGFGSVIGYGMGNIMQMIRSKKPSRNRSIFPEFID